MQQDNQDGPTQGALFRIEGPDEDSSVWCRNLGRFEPAATVIADWLAACGFGK
jgi:hypothetical protein